MTAERDDGLGIGSKVQRRISHKRIHWRALVLVDSQKLPAHLSEISDRSASLLSRYSFPAGMSLRVAVFVPDAKDRSQSVVVELTAKVEFQVMRGDEVQTGLVLPHLAPDVHATILAALEPDA